MSSSSGGGITLTGGRGEPHAKLGGFVSKGDTHAREQKEAEKVAQQHDRATKKKETQATMVADGRSGLARQLQGMLAGGPAPLLLAN